MREKTQIPDEVISDILHKVKLEDIVGRYIDLAPDGRVLSGYCPFHQDEKRSLKVFPKMQMYRCDDCRVIGNVFVFLMERFGISFSQAVRETAEEVGIELKTDEEYVRERKLQFKQNIYASLQATMEFYNQVLMQAPEAKRARKYLQARGFTGETIEKLKIGFAMDRWDLMLNRLRYRYGQDSIEVLKTASIISEKRNKDGYYDYFRNRIMFPIFDLFGKTIGFGGRALNPDDEIKYLNSREIKNVFHKSKMLYLLNHAQRDAVKKGHLILMEGYTDAALAHQHGFTNAFASAGTAFTPEHALLLKQMTDKVIICMDADPAGRKASLEAAMQMLRTDISVELMLLPEGKDPADVLLEEGKNFQNRINAAMPLFEFALEDAVRRHDPEPMHNKARILKELEPILCAAPDAITCKTYVHAAARKLDLPFEIAADAVHRTKNFLQPIQITPFPTTEHEYRIANMLLRKAAYRNEMTLRLLPEHFKNNEIRAMFAYFQNSDESREDVVTSNHRLPKTPSLFDAQYTENLPQEILQFAQASGLPCDESKVYQLVSKLQRTPSPDIPVDIVINSILREHYKQELKKMEQQIEDASIRRDQNAIEGLMQNYKSMLDELQKVMFSNKDSLK